MLDPDFLPLFVLLSLSALIMKGWLLYANRKYLPKYTLHFKILFVSLLSINLLELLSFFLPADESGFVMLCGYYVGVVTALTMIFFIILDACGSRYFCRFIGYILFGVGVLLVVWPGVALDGVKELGVTLTRVEGSFYWVLQCVIVTLSLSSAGMLCAGILRSKDKISKRVLLSLLIALMPLLVVSFVVVALMAFGFQVTGVIFGSFATLFFLVSIFITDGMIFKRVSEQDGTNSFSLLSLIPGTEEYGALSKTRSSVVKHFESSYQKAIQDYELNVVLEAVKESKGNKADAAKKLGISRATLNRKLLRSSI